ncbi:MAG: hypothetical protein FJX45_05865 [Alphaproteobacteria bacterium]|nr:hypothetical protein [Alphaproteobacteria bacterium]
MPHVARWLVIAFALLAAVSCFAGELTSDDLAYLQTIYSQMNTNAARIASPGPGSAYIRFETSRDGRIKNVRAVNATSPAHAAAGMKVFAGVRSGNHPMDRTKCFGQTVYFH